MSQIADEIEAAAWPAQPLRLSSGENWQDIRTQYARELLLGDPLPLVAIKTTDGQWVVPTTDETVWWWTKQAERPDHVPVRTV